MIQQRAAVFDAFASLGNQGLGHESLFGKIARYISAHFFEFPVKMCRIGKFEFEGEFFQAANWIKSDVISDLFESDFPYHSLRRFAAGFFEITLKGF